MVTAAPVRLIVGLIALTATLPLLPAIVKSAVMPALELAARVAAAFRWRPGGRRPKSAQNNPLAKSCAMPAKQGNVAAQHRRPSTRSQLARRADRAHRHPAGVMRRRPAASGGDRHRRHGPHGARARSPPGDFTGLADGNAASRWSCCVGPIAAAVAGRRRRGRWCKAAGICRAGASSSLQLRQAESDGRLQAARAVAGRRSILVRDRW